MCIDTLSVIDNTLVSHLHKLSYVEFKLPEKVIIANLSK